MGFIETSGIVIKQINFDEADKILTILTKDNGKIQVLAKGARRTNNRFLASTQLFCYSDFIFYQGRSMIYMNQAELRESFYNLRTSLKGFTYASYVIELMNAASQEHKKEEKYFFLLIHTLKHMAYTKEIDLDVIVLAFQVKLMALAGYAPHLDNCVSCGSEVASRGKMSAEMGGLICKECYHLDPYARRIQKEAVELLSFILYKPLSSLNQIDERGQRTKQLNKMMNAYVSKYLGKTFHTVHFLQAIDDDMIKSEKTKSQEDKKNR